MGIENGNWMCSACDCIANPENAKKCTLKLDTQMAHKTELICTVISKISKSISWLYKSIVYFSKNNLHSESDEFIQDDCV